MDDSKQEYKFDDIALLIIGYDPYVDVWNHYFDLLNKYWKIRPKTYLATNSLTPVYDNVEVIPVGENAEWSKKVYVASNKIKEKYIVLLLEDFFTTTFVNNDCFVELFDIIKKNNIDYCKLLNQSKIKGICFQNYSYLHIIDKNENYGISLQPSIWNKDFLLTLLGNENYNAWIFELNQIENKIQNEKYINCIADDRNVLEITHTVVQSKYLRKAVRTFKRQKYYFNLKDREQMSLLETVKYRSKLYFSEYSPAILKKPLKGIGRLMGVDFVSDRELGGK
ncbi:hypothetical protein [Candidatus Stoquefichus sp. SB1]|uniref:hypothetical protein n=1 Tax=Candidatus Stoquefichus sp. SB1 TaxID=1658109 RepID=UPI00067EAC80|nr:hypothetical protein [Candidatus Stoquefichus sp. SB1]